MHCRWKAVWVRKTHARFEAGENLAIASKNYLSLSLPKIESAEMMFAASRSRRLQIVPIIQSFSQLDKNYGKEGAEIIVDNTQLTIFGGFAPIAARQRYCLKHLAAERSWADLSVAPRTIRPSPCKWLNAHLWHRTNWSLCPKVSLLSWKQDSVRWKSSWNCSSNGEFSLMKRILIPQRTAAPRGIRVYLSFRPSQ